MIRRCICLGALTTLGLVACSSSDDDKKKGTDTSADEVEAVPFPTTTMLDDATVAAITGSDADGTIHFPASDGAVANIKQGTFIVGGIGPKTPHGLMRYVVSTTPEGGGVAAKTVYAPPQFVFRKLHVKAKRNLPSFIQPGINGKVGPRTLRPLDGGDIQASIPIDVLAFDGDGDESTTDDQLHLTGDIGGGVDYQFGIDFDWGSIAELPFEIVKCLASVVNLLAGGTPSCTPKDLLPEAKAGLSLDVNAHMNANADGVAYLSFERDYPLAHEIFDPIVLGPLVFVPSADLTAHIEGGSSSRFKIGMQATADAGAGVTLSTKNKPDIVPPHAEAGASVTNDDVVLGAKIKASIGPEIAIKLFDVAGPEAGFSIYAELDADSSQTPCYSQHLGIDGNLGVDVSLDLGFLGTLTIADYKDKFNVYDTVTASGTCAAPPAGESKKLPGQGPDDTTFASPSFTPFVAGYEGQFGIFPYSSFEGLGWMSNTLSIDGRTLVTGSHFEALTKVDDAGAIIWSEKLVFDENISSISDRNTNYFRPSRTTIAPDGTIMATADPFAIANFEQNGALNWVKYFDGVGSDDFRRFVDIKPDGAGGYWLIGNRGENYDETIGWLLHIDGTGNVLSSKTWGDPKTRTYASSLTVAPDGVHVGTYVFGGKSMAILTFGLDGSFKSATSYTSGCGGDIEPTTSALRPDGGYVIAGVANALPLNNFVLTFDKTGMPGAISSWGAAQELGQCVPRINSIVPLNSTGYLVSGTCDGDAGTVGDEVYVGGLDAGARPLWGHAFGLLTTAPNGGAEGRAAVRLTDDGGAFLSAYADEGNETGSTHLLIAKLFAKDAKVTAKAPLEVQPDPPLSEGQCLLTAGPSNIVPVDSPATVQDYTARFHTEKVTTTKTDYAP